jgi:metal-sulfur cluster biosynthetic enzyme/nitrite reductase/ring-hydroxylating ferredoxin subunit
MSTTTSDFVSVAKLSELADGHSQLVEVEDRVLALFRVGSEIFCLDDVCTHDGGPLSEGPIDKAACTIACPRHGAKFDLRTGAALTMPATKATQAHEVRLAGDDIQVKLREPGWVPPQTAKAATPVSAAMPAKKEECCGGEHHHAHAAPNSLPMANTCSSAAAACGGKITEDLVLEELKKVIDPELFVNIVDLGLIYNVDLVPAADDKLDCKIDMTMTSPMCPAGPQMIANSKQVLGAVPGMGNVEVKIVLDPPWTPDKMTEAARDQLGIF